MSDLIPVKQTQVIFYGDEVTAVKMGDDSIFVPIRPLCNNLGVDWSAQRKRVLGHAVLSEIVVNMSVAVTATDIEDSNRRPRTSDMLCLPLEYLNGWLFGINADRVKPEIRDTVIRYQKQCYQALWKAFQEGELTTEEDGRTEFETLLQTADPSAIEAYETALAVVKLAKSHIMLQGRIDSHERQLRFHDQRLEEVESALEELGDRSQTLGRLEDVETALGLLGDNPAISEAQASQVSQAVKAVAVVLGKRSGRNEFGSVYGELYRKYSISGYKMLPARQFQDAMTWLAEWLEDLNN